MTLQYKKLCMRCRKFRFFKDQWGSCLTCFEKRFGKYHGQDRKKYVDGNKLKVNA